MNDVLNQSAVLTNNDPSSDCIFGAVKHSESLRALTQIRSPDAFAITYAKVVSAIRDAGLTIFASIDHAAGAGKVGLLMPPTMLLIYGSPRAGTPAMLAVPDVGLDLPLRVLIREGHDGLGVVTFHPVAGSLVQAGVPETLARALQPAQELLINAFPSGVKGCL